MERKADHRRPLLPSIPSPCSPLYQTNIGLAYSPGGSGGEGPPHSGLITQNGFLFPTSGQVAHLPSTNTELLQESSPCYLQDGTHQTLGNHDLKIELHNNQSKIKTLYDGLNQNTFINAEEQVNNHASETNHTGETNPAAVTTASVGAKVGRLNSAPNDGHVIKLDTNGSVRRFSQSHYHQTTHSQSQHLQTSHSHNGKLHGILKPPSGQVVVVDGVSSSMLPPHDCIGRRRPPIGEKCFALIMFFLVGGIIIAAFGATCIIPIGNLDERTYCNTIGGLVTALVLVSGGGLLILLGVTSCILIKECSGQELHGGKCHINCHIFEDLVE